MRMREVLSDEATAVARASVRAWSGPGRQRDLAVQSFKAAGAAVVAWLIAGTWLRDPAALMAPWVAVVLVQTTVYRSVRNGIQQLVAIAVGTLLAAGAHTATGSVTVSMALVLPLMMLLSNWPHFGDQGIYGPTTALFTLASPPVSALTVMHRLLEAGLGAVVGIGVNALVLPPVHLRDVRRHIRGLGEGSADVLDSVAEGLTGGQWDAEAAAGWERRADALHDRLTALRHARQWANESSRMNPRVRRFGRPHAPAPPAAEDNRWAAVVEAVTAITRTLARTSSSERLQGYPDAATLCGYARLLAGLAALSRARAALLAAAGDGEAGGGEADVFGEALESCRRELARLQQELPRQASGGPPQIAGFGTLLVHAADILVDLTPWEEAVSDRYGRAGPGGTPHARQGR
ncbi:aromatic acid exporter family protein [Streptantibioticus rubrisoli]|uniref:Aromatic acid exporter family protein n=1 Tax=Streptantibioticus rubrisoli TaxID=1387313 RepID=A0ABT1PHC0_9ACTN|nr:aromatic acid exporter family protein [Streptantibioticus rubrisoli]MCQ4044735.1 aromatic acid exporter family protein [Streptantibioticus rubrisoli]